MSATKDLRATTIDQTKIEAKKLEDAQKTQAKGLDLGHHQTEATQLMEIKENSTDRQTIEEASTPKEDIEETRDKETGVSNLIEMGP